MYIALGQRHTESPYHFDHLLQVSNKSLSTLLLYIFFNVFFQMDIALEQGQTTHCDKILMSTERPCHFAHLLQGSKKNL